jgi:hypothetical protein
MVSVDVPVAAGGLQALCVCMLPAAGSMGGSWRLNHVKACLQQDCLRLCSVGGSVHVAPPLRT